MAVSTKRLILQNANSFKTDFSVLKNPLWPSRCGSVDECGPIHQEIEGRCGKGSHAGDIESILLSHRCFSLCLPFPSSFSKIKTKQNTFLKKFPVSSVTLAPAPIPHHLNVTQSLSSLFYSFPLFAALPNSKYGGSFCFLKLSRSALPNPHPPSAMGPKLLCVSSWARFLLLSQSRLEGVLVSLDLHSGFLPKKIYFKQTLLKFRRSRGYLSRSFLIATKIIILIKFGGSTFPKPLTLTLTFISPLTSGAFDMDPTWLPHNPTAGGGQPKTPGAT